MSGSPTCTGGAAWRPPTGCSSPRARGWSGAPCGPAYPARSLLITSDKLAAFAELARSCPGPVFVLPPQAAQQLTGYRMHRGVLAAMQRLAPPAVSEVLRGTRPGVAGPPGQAPTPPRRIVVLEDIVDHANVGGIFRSAAALGVDAVILSPRCADPLYRRSVRVSMGAVFAIPYARMTGWYDGLAELRAAGFRLLAMTPDQSAVPIGAVTPGERAALLLGTEGDGLSSRWLSEADEAVCIPMAPGATEAGVDSLNVVAAAAIACQFLSADYLV